MPELPDVEIFKEYLDATALHQRIMVAEAKRSRMFTGIAPEEVEKRLRNRRIEESRRTGKYLFARLDEGGWIVFHFGMTGYLRYFKNEEEAPGHIILLLTFENGYHLAYNCRRRLGRIYWTDSPQKFAEEKGLGPDVTANGLDFHSFEQILAAHGGALKPLLMDQSVMAGIGNIYSDEILFQIGTHPKTSAGDLAPPQQKLLYETMNQVLRTAIDRRVGEKGWPDDWLIAHRKPGDACPRCGGEIRKETIGGRSSYFCADHQQR